MNELTKLWKPITKTEPASSIPVLGFSPDWVDADFCPSGIRDCFRTDLQPSDKGQPRFISSKWNNSQDCYDVDDETCPTLFLDPSILSQELIASDPSP